MQLFIYSSFSRHGALIWDDLPIDNLCEIVSQFQTYEVVLQLNLPRHSSLQCDRTFYKFPQVFTLCSTNIEGVNSFMKVFIKLKVNGS